PREYFIFEDMNFGSFMQSYRGLSMVRFTHVKTSHDKAKDFFLIAPKQIIKYFDPKTVTQSKLNYTYTTISEPYEISELKQRLNDIFENKISLPIFEPLFEVKKEKSKIKMLTVDEINEWINRSRDLQGTFLHSSDKTAAQLLTNQVIVQFLSEIQEPIKNTLSVIGQSKIFSKLHGEILIKLSELIMVHKSYTTNVVNAEDAIRIFINEIAPTRGYDYQGKFGLITTRDYFYFLVPIALIRSLKELVVNNIDFEWIGLYQVDVNVEILKSALNKCYATNSTDLRSAINREVINSQKRWYKPWTWNWGGYYFKKESYKRDYPEKAKAYAAAQKELLAEE
ncbi:MAG TPA: hypothetical protein VL201_01275, partial [Patescibacteria group bacterium]|nr:hypothetical protein [Patescibacteria group bacterium]